MADPKPLVNRPNCRCQKPVRQWARVQLAKETAAWQSGHVGELTAISKRANVPKIGDVIDAYLAGLPGRMHQTGLKNTNSLKAVVEQATGRAPLQQRIDVLDRKLALKWMQLRQAYNQDREDYPDETKETPKSKRKRRTWDELRKEHAARTLPALETALPLAGNYTINSMLRTSRSVIGTKARTYYLGEMTDRLPASLDSFLKISSLPSEKGHVGLTPKQIGKVQKLGKKWKEKEPEKWIAYALEYGCGLRPIEVLAARGSWIENFEKRRVLVVKNRPEEDFYQKARGAAIVKRYELSPDLLAAIGDRPGYLFEPDATKTARENLLRREISKELGAVLPAGKGGTNYRLRKEFGSALYKTGGKEAASAGLRHATSEVAEAHYIDDADVVPMTAI